MNIVWMILIGFVVGAIAKMLVPGQQGGGFVMTTVLGIAGSLFGSWVFGMLGMGGGMGFVGAVVGAVLLLLLFRAMNK
jgi:uncharacterized membrane protein YeaQ/YmgE (transglycosylase-associated protein family)